MPEKASSDSEQTSNDGGNYARLAVIGIGCVAASYYLYQHYKGKHKKKPASIVGSYGSGTAVHMDRGHNRLSEDRLQESRQEEGRQEGCKQEGCHEEGRQQEGRQEISRKETSEPKKKIETTCQNQCSRDQYLAILKETISAMEISIRNLAHKEKKFKKDGIDPDTIAKKLNATYIEYVEAARKRALEKHNTTEEQVFIASNKYVDEEILAQTKKIEKIQAALRGEPIELTADQLAIIPDNFTIDRLMELFQELFERIAAAHQETQEEVKRQLANSSDGEYNQLCNTINANKTLEIRTDIFAKYNITENILDVAMQKYMHEPRLQKKMMTLQKKQQQTYMGT